MVVILNLLDVDPKVYVGSNPYSQKVKPAIDTIGK